MGASTSGDPRSFDRFAADYDRFASFEAPWLTEWLLPHLPPRPRRAFDAGCGSGRHTVALAEHFDEVLAADVSRPLIEIARRRRPHPAVRYQVADLLSIDDPNGFDLVFSSATLHHLPDLESALRHLRRLVGPEGTAVLIDNVARRPTPPRWVYGAGALREVPGDLLRHGWREARWMFGFRTSKPWLDHLAADRYLSRRAFEHRFGAVFPGARFVALGNAHALIWHQGRSSPASE